eukprot:TRINITY_DN584_c0_g1_i6.p5 TRINITY_DN584_c0_g1~~TRINITY_DN584_c0_g1_i6.p5  ORF type:complete len:148 (+),score=31.49 TRINITY_DN584_c0_g1_i6:96-539(+)
MGTSTPSTPLSGYCGEARPRRQRRTALCHRHSRPVPTARRRGPLLYTRAGPAADGELTRALPEIGSLRPGGSYGFKTVITRNTGVTESELPSRSFFTGLGGGTGGGAVPRPMMMGEFGDMRKKAATTLMADAPGVAADVGITVGVAL